jgi:signal peptidase I
MISKKTSGESAAGKGDSQKSLVEEDKKNNQQQKKEIFDAFVKLGAFCLIIWIIFTFLFGITKMQGETMYPKVRDGDLMLYYRLQKEYHSGDVITFMLEGNRRTARVVAVGGDVVDINYEGELLINGNVQSEEIFYSTEKLTNGVTYPYTVEENSYFVLCDFRTSSIDSRRYGAIPKKDISGKVITILRRRGI